MDKKPPKRPKLDVNQLAHSIMEQATGEKPIESAPKEKNQAAVELGKLGGKKGGAARAKSLTAERKAEIAKRAADARWNKKKQPL
ncbi:MAG TPA: hypothetical protein VGK97_03170 [Spongiibacteraceae bacterium]|jgi:hypothetical protein